MVRARFDDRAVDLVIPAYGRPELVNALLGDLTADRSTARPRITVVDNLGDVDGVPAGVRVVRPERNLRWIGTVNWALEDAARNGSAVCVILNSDIRLSNPFLDGLVAAITDNADVAIAAPCYDDYWPHQHARDIPDVPTDFVATDVVREAPFCDGAAIGFSTAAVAAIGVLDMATFSWHGYGADIDIALRSRRAGYRVLVTEACYVSHSRHGSMPEPGVDVRRPREEIEQGLTAKYGPDWRRLVGLPDSSLRADALTADGDLAERHLSGDWRAVRF